jgi:RimJ/RimL family protein N-acetyltransferase
MQGEVFKLAYKKLIGEKVSLAPITPDLGEKWAEWLTDLAVSIPLGDEAYMSLTPDGMRKDIGNTGPRDHVFSIVANEGDLPIGRCLLFNVDHINRSSFLGIFIGDKEYWSKGYGREAITLLLEYAFNLLNLNSVMLGVFSFNERAIQCYKSVGFKEIGRRRQSRLIGGKYYDGVLMDILAEEFNGTIISRYLEAQNT